MDFDCANLISIDLLAWQTPMGMVQSHPQTNLQQLVVVFPHLTLELRETLQAGRFSD